MERRNFVNGAMATIAGLAGAGGGIRGDQRLTLALDAVPSLAIEYN